MNWHAIPFQERRERNVFCSSIRVVWIMPSGSPGHIGDCGDCQHKLDQGARPEMKLTVGDSVESYD